MIITFCGHSQIGDIDRVKSWLTITVETLIKNGARTFYLGGYGDFDMLASAVVREMKVKYPTIESVLVLPYLNKSVNTALYDATVYPPLENTPKRYCILKRNQWMVEHSDIVVSYITHDWGGAAKTYEHALKKGKSILNYGGNLR